MNKLAVILPIYKREEITSLCLENLMYQSDKFGIDVFVVGSEGNVSSNLVAKYGFYYLERPNNPVSQKLNSVLKFTKDYDGVILMGSDNFISDSIFEMFLKIDTKEAICYGFDDIHFYDVDDKLLATKGSYNRAENMSIGVGRMFTKALLEKANYNLWRGDRNNGLDSLSHKTIKALGSEVIFRYDKKYFMLDVKHEESITNHAIVRTCTVIEETELMQKYLPKIYDKIINLKPKKNKHMKPMRTNPITKTPKVTIEITKSVAGMEVGERRSVAKKIAIKAVENGWAKVIVEKKPKVEESKPAKKMVEEKTKAKKTTKKKAK